MVGRLLWAVAHPRAPTKHRLLPKDSHDHPTNCPHPRPMPPTPPTRRARLRPPTLKSHFKKDRRDNSCQDDSLHDLRHTQHARSTSARPPITDRDTNGILPLLDGVSRHHCAYLAGAFSGTGTFEVAPLQPCPYCFVNFPTHIHDTIALLLRAAAAD